MSGSVNRRSDATGKAVKGRHGEKKRIEKTTYEIDRSKRIKRNRVEVQKRAKKKRRQWEKERPGGGRVKQIEYTTEQVSEA